MERDNFLDVTLDLNKGKYCPYRKPNDQPLYVNKDSNHPPSILKQLPKSISKRLSSISSTEHEFHRAAPMYQKALANSGYTDKLAYTKPNSTNTSRKTNKRKIIWFNPPFSKSVVTNTEAPFSKIEKRGKKEELGRCFDVMAQRARAIQKGVWGHTPRENF